MLYMGEKEKGEGEGGGQLGGNARYNKRGKGLEEGCFLLSIANELMKGEKRQAATEVRRLSSRHQEILRTTSTREETEANSE